MGRATLHHLADGPGDDVTVFVHGYKAVGSAAAFDELVAYVLRARPSGTSYLLCWDSGSWSETASVFAGKAIGRGAGALLVGGAVGLGANFLDFTTTLVGDYRRREREAEDVGARLRRHLSRIPNAKRRKIHLVGHSLGARVIHYGLAMNDWSSYRLGDVVLLGGAADADDDDWTECAAKIEGKIINVFCPLDGVLKIAPALRRYIGLRPIPGRRRGIRNHRWAGIDGGWAPSEVSTTVGGHVSYWFNLEHLLRSYWPGFTQRTKHYFEWKVACPRNGEHFFVSPEDDVYSCPSCGMDVEIDGLQVVHK